ncbi:very short patch repair endonuclease [Spongorhabdus nitratireducens]
MTDTVDSATRSQNMSRIRSKNTKPELLVRKYLFSSGFRYCLNDRKLPGRPDIVLRKYKAVIFVHGCFWHHHQGCRLAYSPRSRTGFWQKKFSGNVSRDEKVKQALLEIDWRVLVIWECATRSKKCLDYFAEVESWIKSSSSYSEISASDEL